MKMRTRDLSGVSLDWAVAVAAGDRVHIKGGRVVDAAGHAVDCCRGHAAIAHAMRRYVTSHLGYVVDIPDEIAPCAPLAATSH